MPVDQDAQTTTIDWNNHFDVRVLDVGMKLKPKRNVELGMAYEFPLTAFEDIIKDRWTFDAIIRY